MNTATQQAQQDDSVIDGEVTEIKAPDNALVVLNPTKYVQELLAPFHAQLKSAKSKAARQKYDVSTKEGMTLAKELRSTFVSIRTSADKAKTAAKRPIDQAGKLILAEYQLLETAAKAEEAKHDKAIRDEEARLETERQAKIAAERARIEAIENRLAAIKGLPARNANKSSEDIKAVIEELRAKQIDPALYDEHLEDAITSLNTSIDELTRMHDVAVEREAAARKAEEDARELARLKAEQAARDAEQARKLKEEADKAATAQAELEQLRAQLVAMQKATEPPAPEPETPPAKAAPNVVDVAEPAPFELTAESLVEVAPVAPAVPLPLPRPSEEEIVQAVCRSFQVQSATALGWLLASDFRKVVL